MTGGRHRHGRLRAKREPGTLVPARRRRSLLVLTMMLAGLTGVISLHAVTPASAALQGDVQIGGHGYGHGRGLSQYGAMGYAVDYGWTWQQILDHYYGGTVAGTTANAPIGVELLAQAGRNLIVTSRDLMVNGTHVNAPAVMVRRNPSGTFDVLRGTSCTSTFAGWQGSLPARVVLSGGGAATDPANNVQICESKQVHGYRGSLVAVNTGSSSAVVNSLPVEDYLRGVVPSEMPASWADLGGGKGANALRAQAVAARSYALSRPRNSYATTCDTDACQVYKGLWTKAFPSANNPNPALVSVEDARANAAILATAGQVRKTSSGTISRTEFSASTGGWTAAGDFPAVEDLGDATAANPYHNWAVSINAGTLAGRLGTPPITGISVTQRNGLGADGGRVLRVVVDTSGGAYAFTGNQFRIAVGLRSDWFKFNVRSYTESVSYTKALYHDLLGRTPSPSEVAPWAGSVAAGADPGSVSRAFLGSTEHLRSIVAGAYAGALKRTPDPGGSDSWVRYLRSGKNLNDLNAELYSSAESLRALGQGDMGLWVDGLYQGLMGRAAGAPERAHWVDVANTRGRKYVAFNISSSVEARKKRLAAYYATLLQRGVDETGMATWIPQMAGNGDVQVQIFIAGSKEYWNKAITRFP